MSDIHQCPLTWQFITSAKAWSLAGKSGKMAPYSGYMIELKDGSKLRCRRDAHKNHLRNPMKLTLISLLSLIIGLFLGYSALFTAKQIANSTMPRIEIALDQ